MLHSSCALSDQALRKGTALFSKYHMGHIPGEPSSGGVREDGHTDLAPIGMKRAAERASSSKRQALLSPCRARMSPEVLLCIITPPDEILQHGGMLGIRSTEQGLPSLSPAIIHLLSSTLSLHSCQWPPDPASDGVSHF